MKLTEIKNTNIWKELNQKAEERFGEFGLMTCDEESIAQLIDLPKANKLAKTMFGEFGFATLDEKQAEELITKYPNLVK